MELSADTLRSLLTQQLSTDDLRKDVVTPMTTVDYLESPVTYEEFFLKYLLPNKLCVLGPWATDGWRSRREWVTDDGVPNFAFLKKEFGGVKCPVADCNAETYSSHPKSEMMVHEFIEYMEKYSAARHPSDEKCFYLKDWHFTREFPHYKAYDVPPYFESDWMNEFWDQRNDVRDDYRFVYIGPKGSWTPFHSDVFRSFSWSANICGRKKWIFFAPGEEAHLCDSRGQLPFDLNSPALEDKSRFPSVEKVSRRFEVYQEQGEVVFVPSGWHHQVFNLEDTISINHNWMNACNLDLCWRHLVGSLEEVQREIADCRDMDEWGAQCQLVMRASSGMDYSEFYRYLCYIVESRLESVASLTSSSAQSGPCLENSADKRESDKEIVQNLDEKVVGRSLENLRSTPRELAHRTGGHGKRDMNHCMFDLYRIKNMLTVMKKNREFLQINFDDFPIRPKALITKISHALDEFMSKFGS